LKNTVPHTELKQKQHTFMVIRLHAGGKASFNPNKPEEARVKGKKKKKKTKQFALRIRTPIPEGTKVRNALTLNKGRKGQRS